MKSLHILLRFTLILALALSLASCSEDDPVDVDSTPPTASISFPADSDSIYGPITIRATASDNDAVASVEFLANGVSLGVDVSSPYQQIWDPQVLRTDIVNYTLTARATDLTGNTGNSAPVAVTYINDDVLPTVAIISPLDGSELEGPVMIQVNADDDVKVDQVRVVIDEVDIGGDDEAPYEFYWEVGPWADGLAHNLTAKAVDSSGNIGSTTISVTISTLAAPPVVNISFPTNNSHLGDETTVIEVNATDTDQIEWVAFYVDGDSIGVDTEEPYSQQWDLLFWADDAEHVVGAKAVDERGNVGVAPEVTVTIAATAGLDLIAPEDNSVIASAQADTLFWQYFASAIQYEYQVSTQEDFSTVDLTATTGDTLLVMGGLLEEWYYWRVRAQNAGERWSEWSETWSFHIGIVFATIYGGFNADEARFVDLTDDGGYVFTGFYRLGEEAADSLVWIVKTDAQGDTIWSQLHGVPGEHIGRSIRQTSDGGYIIVGDTFSYRAGIPDLWLIKTDDQGGLVWDQTYGGESWESGCSIQQTGDGGYIIVGSTASFGAGEFDIWLLRTSAQGDTLWTKTFGGALSEHGAYVEQTGDGGFLIASSAESFGASDKDYWLIKTDDQGVTEWSFTKGGAMDDQMTCARQTLDGGFILVGYSRSYGAGESDLLVARLNASGTELWSRVYGGSGYDGGRFVEETNDGSFIITGETRPFWAQQADVWLLRLSAAGDEIWSKVMGGNSNEVGYCVRQTADSGYIIAGYTGSFSAGARDCWLIKTDHNGNTVPIGNE